MTRTQILLVDPHQLSREGLKRLLDGESCDVTGARSLDEAGDQIEKGLRPELIVVAFEDSASDVQAAMIQYIRTNFASLKVIVIANNISPALLSHALSAGVCACLLRDISTEALTGSIQLVLLGQQVFPTQAAMLLLGTRTHGQQSSNANGHVQNIEEQLRPRGVSSREGQILKSLLHGLPNKMIARELGISEATVKVHVKALLRKVNAHNRTQAAVWGLANGFGENTSPEHLAEASLPATDRIAVG